MKQVNLDYTIGYLKEYPYRVNLHREGVEATELIWCQQNCIGKYGWHFKDTEAILTFENKKDAFIYKLVRLR